MVGPQVAKTRGGGGGSPPRRDHAVGQSVGRIARHRNRSLRVWGVAHRRADGNFGESAPQRRRDAAGGVRRAVNCGFSAQVAARSSSDEDGLATIPSTVVCRTRTMRTTLQVRTWIQSNRRPVMIHLRVYVATRLVLLRTFGRTQGMQLLSVEYDLVRIHDVDSNSRREHRKSCRSVSVFNFSRAV